MESQDLEPTCDHNRDLLAFHGVLDSCHSRKEVLQVRAKISFCAAGRKSVEVWMRVSDIKQSHRLALGLLSCSSKIPPYLSTVQRGKCGQFQLMVLPSLLLFSTGK